MRLRLGFIFSLFATVALAQSGKPVIQSGNVTPNQVPWWITSGVIGGGVTSADSPITSFGVTNNGLQGLCVNSDRITAVGRNTMCFGVRTAGGPAQITVQNFGTAAPLGFQYVIDGTTITPAGGITNITVGSTTIGSGTNGAPLFDNAGIVGNGVIASTWSTYQAIGSGGALRTAQVRLQDSISILDYGGVVDSSSAYNSTNATSNATALNNALLQGKCVSFPGNPNGYSLAAQTVVLGTGACVIGDEQVQLKSQPTSNQWVFHITAAALENGALPSGYVNNIRVDTTGAASGSTVFRFATSAANVGGFQFGQAWCTNAYECIGDESSAAQYVYDVKIYDVRTALTLGRQFHLTRSRGFIWADSLRVDNTQSSQTIPVTWEGARFEDFQGLEINRYDMVGPSTAQTTTYQSTCTGLYLNGTSGGGQSTSVWLGRILIDNTACDGITLNNVTYVNGNWLESFQNLGNAIQFKNVINANVTNVLAYGAVGLTGAATGANGVSCNPCTGINIANLYSTLNTGSGLVLAGTTDTINLANFVSSFNTGFAMVLVGTTVQGNVVVDGGNWFTNGGVLSNSSTGKVTIRDVSGFPLRTQIADANYVAIPSDDGVSYSSISAARIISLPAASNYAQGRVLIISDISGSASGSNTISAAPSGTDQINGSNTTQVMVNSAYGSVGLASNGSNAWVYVVTGVVAGGTGSGTASGARTNLGLGTAATQNTGTSGANVPLLNGNNTDSGTNTHSGANTFSGQIISTFGTPTIASGACGTGTNGSISGTNQSGVITIGAVGTTTCTIGFSATITAPNACLIFPGNAAAAATGTTVARVGAPSTTQWVITGSALASTIYSYICL